MVGPIRALDEQIRDAHEAEDREYLWHHIDTCLPCYLGNHHNGDNELLLGVPVDGSDSVSDVMDYLNEEFHAIAYQMGETKRGYDHDKALAALKALFDEVRPNAAKTFDASLEIPSEGEDMDETVQAYFLLTWQVPEEGGDA